MFLFANRWRPGGAPRGDGGTRGHPISSQRRPPRPLAAPTCHGSPRARHCRPHCTRSVTNTLEHSRYYLPLPFTIISHWANQIHNQKQYEISFLLSGGRNNELELNKFGGNEKRRTLEGGWSLREGYWGEEKGKYFFLIINDKRCGTLK